LILLTLNLRLADSSSSPHSPPFVVFDLIAFLLFANIET
jgi:hypothetical protein